MIQVTKAEADYIKEKKNDVSIILTGRQKKGRCKKRYVEDTPEICRLLKEFRKYNLISMSF